MERVNGLGTSRWTRKLDRDQLSSLYAAQSIVAAVLSWIWPFRPSTKLAAWRSIEKVDVIKKAR